MRLWRWIPGTALLAVSGLAHGQHLVHDETTSLRLEGMEAELHVRGAMRFTPDLRDVVRVDSGARLTLMGVAHDGATLRLEIVRGPGGELERSYRVNGAAAPYDSAAAGWVHRLLPRLLPQTTGGMRTRLEQVRREHGLDSVLALAHRPNEGQLGRDYTALVEDSTLTPAEFIRVVQSATQDLADTPALGPFLSAAAASALAWRYDSLYAQVIRASGTTPRGEERMEALRGLAMGGPPAGPLSRAALMDAVRRLEFDDQRVRVLYTVVEWGGAQPERTADAIRTAAGLERPADRVRVLLAVRPYDLRLPPVRAAYEQALAGLPEGPEKSRAAAHLAGAPSAVQPTQPGEPR